MKQTQQQPAHWLNRQWTYVPASSHSNAQAFSERQRARLAAAQTKQRKQ
jgi:hypothetical protein